MKELNLILASYLLFFYFLSVKSYLTKTFLKIKRKKLDFIKMKVDRVVNVRRCATIADVTSLHTCNTCHEFIRKLMTSHVFVFFVSLISEVLFRLMKLISILIVVIFFYFFNLNKSNRWNKWCEESLKREMNFAS